MSIIETGAYAALAMQVSVGAAGPDKVAGNRPAAAAQVQQPSGNTDATTIRVPTEFTQLQNINDRQNQAAFQLRSDDQQLQQSGQLLGQMKHLLFRIIKNYPPFDPGDQERIKYLKSFNGLRQQIERLTVPPDGQGSDKTPEALLPNGGSNQAGSPSNSAASATVPGAATTFGIPELPDMASDAQIETTAHLIDNAQTTIAGRRAAMAEQTPGINRSTGYGAKAEELNRTSPGTWDLIVPADNAAEQKSIEAGSGLAQAPANSITEAGMRPLLQSMAG